jgi:peptidoglycan/LPS O-acetylase OafA/YrhL
MQKESASPTQAVSSYLPFIDYFRGVAILLVFVYHATFIVADQIRWPEGLWDFHVSLLLLPATFGWAGVSIFFVISGFCIHLSHERAKDKSMATFFIRRFFRIYPPYLVALLIFAACRLEFHAHPWESFRLLAWHALLLNNYLDYSGISATFWSIAVEAQLYLLYPVLLAISDRMGWRKTLWITAAIELGIRLGTPLFTYFFPNVHEILYVIRSPFYYWFIWTIGAALADAYLQGKPLPFARGSLLFWVGISVAVYYCGPLSSLSWVGFAIATAYAMAYCLNRPGLTCKPFRGSGFLINLIQFTGIVSYSMYLLHQPMMKIIVFLLSKHAAFSPSVICGLMLLTWGIIFALSYLFYRCLELPGIALGKSIIERRKLRLHQAAAHG